jgi:hypothetical protein
VACSDGVLGLDAFMGSFVAVPAVVAAACAFAFPSARVVGEARRRRAESGRLRHVPPLPRWILPSVLEMTDFARAMHILYAMQMKEMHRAFADCCWTQSKRHNVVATMTIKQGQREYIVRPWINLSPILLLSQVVKRLRQSRANRGTSMRTLCLFR